MRRTGLTESRAVFAGYGTRMLAVTGEGPALLFLHGYGDSADTWRPAMARMARTGVHMVALDLPGFGEADRLHRRAILPQLEDFASAAVRRLSDESGAPVVVVGNSMGGCVALRMAEKGDERIAGVVTVAPAGLDMGGWYALIERDLLLRGVITSPVPIPAAVIREVVGRAYRVLAFSNPTAAPPEVVRSFASHYSDRRAVSRRLAVARALLPELRDPFELHRVACPALVVWGDRDRMVFHTGAERLREGLRDVTVEILEGCGHCPQVEAPDRFVALVRAFREQLVSGDLDSDDQEAAV